MSEIVFPWRAILIGALVPAARLPEPQPEPEPHELPASSPVTGAVPPEDPLEPNPRWCKPSEEACYNCGRGLLHHTACPPFEGDYEAPIDPALCEKGPCCRNCGRNYVHMLPCPGAEHHRPRPDEEPWF